MEQIDTGSRAEPSLDVCGVSLPMAQVPSMKNGRSKKGPTPRWTLCVSEVAKAGWSNTLTRTEGVPIERQTRLIMSALSCAGLNPTRVMLLSPATIRLSLPCWLVALMTAAAEANRDLENTN